MLMWSIICDRWCSAVCVLCIPYSDKGLLQVAPAVGAALGTSKAGIGIAGLSTFKPELIMKVCAILICHSSF